MEYYRIKFAKSVSYYPTESSKADMLIPNSPSNVILEVSWSCYSSLGLIHCCLHLCYCLHPCSCVFCIRINIQHGMARPLNTLVLHGDADADQEPIMRPILDTSHKVVRSSNINVGVISIDGQKNIVRKLVIDNTDPSPKGPGHKGLLTSDSQLNN